MKKFYQKVKNWSNGNQGLLSLLALIVAVLSSIPFGSININSASPFFKTLGTFLIYKIQLPVYLLILLLISLLFYFLRLKNKYTSQTITLNFLVGTWKNEWTINGETRSEIFIITNDFHYIINGQHMFNIDNFSYHSRKNEIEFTKTAVQPDDHRKHLNKVTIRNNELLDGSEDNYLIKYTRIIN